MYLYWYFTPTLISPRTIPTHQTLYTHKLSLEALTKGCGLNHWHKTIYHETSPSNLLMTHIPPDGWFYRRITQFHRTFPVITSMTKEDCVCVMLLATLFHLVWSASFHFRRANLVEIWLQAITSLLHQTWWMTTCPLLWDFWRPSKIR